MTLAFERCCVTKMRFAVFEAILKRFQRVSFTLQHGLKHRETTKNTTGKQGKSVLFTEHQILGI